MSLENGSGYDIIWNYWWAFVDMFPKPNRSESDNTITNDIVVDTTPILEEEEEEAPQQPQPLEGIIKPRKRRRKTMTRPLMSIVNKKRRRVY